MPKGKRRVGISISHLRVPEEPCVHARRVEGGWELSGTAAWVSGYRLFDWLVVGFFCPEEDREGMVLVRFKRGRTFKVGRVHETLALSALQTVSVEFREHFVPDEQLLSLVPLGTFGRQNVPMDVHFVNLSALALGFLREREEPQLRAAYVACRAAYLERGVDGALYGEMLQIAEALGRGARQAAGPRSILSPHPLERLSRELLLFSVIIDPDR